MASWEDGPEYAPSARPDGYELPDTPPMPVARPVPSLVDGAPAIQPTDFAEPPVAVRPLAAVEVVDRHPRDPRRPYDVEQTAITSGTSAWGHTHSSILQPSPAMLAQADRGAATPTVAQFDANRPVAISGPGANQAGSAPGPQGPSAPPGYGYPTPGTPGWFGPGANYGSRGPAPVSFEALWQAVTPTVAISLAVGVLLTFFLPVAPLALAVAFAGSFAIRYRQAIVRTVMGMATGLLAFVAVIGLLLGGQDLQSWWATCNITAWLCCWFAAPIVALVVRSALANRERPAR